MVVLWLGVWSCRTKCIISNGQIDGARLLPNTSNGLIESLSMVAWKTRVYTWLNILLKIAKKN